MEAIVGCSNRYLEVNLSNGTIVEGTVSTEDRKRYLGGKGLALKLIYDRIRPGIDPLGEENIVAIMLGVLLGTGAPCSGRFAAVTKSPLTGIFTASSCGGPFGMALKTAGYDGLLVTGAAAEPTILEISSRHAELIPARTLWGKDISEVQETVASGKKDGALVIGPAGENLVRYANIGSGHRFLGRGGMGAVFGAKRLKAVVARGGAFRILPRDQEMFSRAKKRATAYIHSNRFTADRYRNYGTNANTRPCLEAGILPVHNFLRGSDPRADDLSGEVLKNRLKTSFSTCKPCTILCGHKGRAADGSVHQVPEFETMGMLGPNLGFFDAEVVTQLNDICCRKGLDTISAGGTLAWAMEAGEKGLLDTGLRFGSTEGIADMLVNIAHCRGIGAELARGTRWLSAKYGGEEFAQHVKGLEVPAYDPRGSWGQGLGYAVANRGGCHLSAYLIGMEIYTKTLNPYRTGAKASWVRFFESLTNCINSLHTCQFTMYAYILEAPLTKVTPAPILGFLMQFLPAVALALTDIGLYRRLWSSVTGIPMADRTFLTAGDRIHVLERHMNVREGIRRKDDTLPPRFLLTGREDDPSGNRVPLERMLEEYYTIRGYDPQGVPRRSTLKRLHIDH